MTAGLFKSFFLGGFECSTHRLRSGKRLDLVHSTRHDQFALSDYRHLQERGIYTVRETRWHLIEQNPGVYDFSSAEPIIRAARETGTEVIWDFWHYGWPDDIDIFSPEFVTRFTSFALAATEVMATNFEMLFICPVNEISFFSWAGRSLQHFQSVCKNRGNEIKCQLVQASLAAIRAIRQVSRNIQICHIDPMINVIAGETRPSERGRSPGLPSKSI